jgi:hypothetical protein
MPRFQRDETLPGVTAVTQSRLRNVAASVRQRLLNLSKEKSEAFDLVLTRYALERLLYRIGRSEWRSRFLLKGAMLYTLWFDAPYRSTRDLDLLGFGPSEIPQLEETFRALCEVAVEDDGLTFLKESVRGSEIRAESEYQGVRMQMTAILSGAVIPLQIDVAFGDVVLPGPEEVRYTTILDLPAPEVLAYPRYTVVSEKFQAMVMLGIANSRLKDFYDIWELARQFEFDGLLLTQSIRATFERRRTALPVEIPLALTDSFSQDRAKMTQWGAFIRKNRLMAEKVSLQEVAVFLTGFLMPPVRAIQQGKVFEMIWTAPGPWKPGRPT